jgi:hypothetical protein
MKAEREINYILPDCFLAMGQAVGTDKSLDFETVVWLRERYKVAFLHAMVAKGNSWEADRRRVTAVGRYMGLQAKAHARDKPTIDIDAAGQAAIEIERGCQMSAKREAFDDGRLAVVNVP